MASILVGINFPEQIKETRKKIQDSFKRSHEALRVRESSLLSRVDQIETEYNNKTQEINELVESLNSIISLSSNRLKSNQLSDTKDAVTTVINNKITELTADTHSTIDFEWDGIFENNIKQLGSIKFDSPTKIPISSPNISTHDSIGQQQQRERSKFGFSSPFIPGPSMFSAEPSNPSTNLFNKQTNVFSPNQKSTFTFSATGNTPHTPTAPFAFTGAPQPNQQNTPTTPQTPTYANFNIGSNQHSSDVSKQVIKTPIKDFSFTDSITTNQQNKSLPLFNQGVKTIPSNSLFNAVFRPGTVPQIETTEPAKEFVLKPNPIPSPQHTPIKDFSSTGSITTNQQNKSLPLFNQGVKTIPSNSLFNAVFRPGTVPQIETTEPAKEFVLKPNPIPSLRHTPIKHFSSTSSITTNQQNIPKISQTASNIKPVSYKDRDEIYKPAK